MVVAKKSLIYDNSFDLPSFTTRDPLIAFRVLVRTLREIIMSDEVCDLSNHQIIAIDARKENKEAHREYCDVNGLLPFTELFSAQDSLRFIGRINKIRVAILAIVTFAIISPFILNARRANYALCINYVARIETMRILLRRYSTKTIYDFAAYFNYSNLATLVYRAQGIQVVKVPSIVPLSAHLRSVIADTLALSSPYHVDEFECFSKEMRVNRTVLTYPKHSRYLAKYQHQNIHSESGSIAFYSHASWMRSKQKHAESLFGLSDQEEVLVQNLSRICKNIEGVKLVVFTHPRERKLEIRNEVEDYYRKLIDPEVNYQVYYGEQPSSAIFEFAEIGVGTMSSILFERLLCGFKTIFFTEKMMAFPVPNSSIKAICADNRIELERLILESLGVSDLEYFDRKLISNYRFDSEFYQQQN